MQFSKPSLNVGGWVLVAGAVIPLMVSFSAYRQTHRFVQSANRTRGSVIRINERSGRGAYGVCYPVFTFTDWTGQAHEITCDVPSDYHYQVGDSVTVLYRPAQPESARLYSFFDIWGSAAIPAGFGFVVLVIGLGMLISALLVQRPKPEMTI